MIDANVIVEHLNDMYYIVTDDDNNIVTFNNIKALEIYKKIITNSLSIKNFNENDIEYYLKDTKEWYECIEMKIDNQNVKVFKNITKYKTREKSLLIDETTGLPNKKLTDNLLNECIESAKKNDEEFSVIFCDIDFFKNINDIYGHDCGDVILKLVGELFRKETRQNNHPNYIPRPLDITGRHGGEEFLIVLRNISEENGYRKIDNIREKIENLKTKYDGKLVGITMTFGMYHAKTNLIEEIKDIDEYRSFIMRKADIALYEGKRTGRNKVVIYDDKIINEAKVKTKNI